jgi:hypothetical protein
MYFMNVAKGKLTVDGTHVNVSMPFAKVDKAKRLVHGFATLDNVDSEDDRVTAAASARAFARARGNIREMHENIAVGRMVDFREDEFFDADSGETYRGMYVTARVSEGAPNTWLKVLDGTLSGFSIGGEILKASNAMSKDGSKTVREIDDYELTELSLVDNPANPLANFDKVEKSVNVVSFTKSAGGSVKVGGMVAETVLENVFICPGDNTVIIKTVDTLDCPECGTKMEMAGWFEEGPDRAEKVRDIVAKYFGATDKEAAAPEGGVEMAKAKDNETAKETNIVNPGEEHSNGDKVDEAAETEPAALEVEETDGVEEETVEVADPDEVHDEATELSKKIDELHETIKKTVADANAEHGGRFESLEKKIDEVHEETSQLAQALVKMGEDLNVAKNRMAEMENSLNKMNSADALRKSAELEDEPVETKNVQKTSSWNGAFSGGTLAARKGSFIDSL